MKKLEMWFVVTAGFANKEEADSFLQDFGDGPPVVELLSGLAESLQERFRQFLVSRDEPRIICQREITLGDPEA